MKKVIISVVVAAASLVAALPTAAQQAPSPWYVRGALGQSIYDIDGLPGDNKGMSLNAGVGYAFSKNVSVEAGYANFGSFSASGLNGEAASVYVGPVLSAPF
jgi:opacity protein-like surface antigen